MNAPNAPSQDPRHKGAGRTVLELRSLQDRSEVDGAFSDLIDAARATLREVDAGLLTLEAGEVVLANLLDRGRRRFAKMHCSPEDTRY